MKKLSKVSIEALVEKAGKRYWEDDFKGALADSEKALLQARAAGDFDRQAECLIVQMNAYMSLGEVERARAASTRLIKLASGKCSRETYANALIESGHLHLQYLEYKTAEEQTAEALIIARDEGIPSLEADALVQLAELDTLRQNFREALVYLREALRVSRQMKNTTATLETIMQQGMTYGAAGMYEKALDCLEEAATLAKRGRLHQYEVESLLCQGDIFRSIGDFDKAERLYNSALDTADKHNVQTKTAEILKRVGNLLLHRRDFDKAIAWYRFCETEIQRFKSSSHFPFVALGYGTAYTGLGDYKRAVECFWKVLDLLSPHYFPHATLLPQVLDQLGLAFNYLNEKKQSLQVGDMARRVRELAQTGIDGSAQLGLQVTALENELNILLASLKVGAVTVFSRGGIRVDLTTGEIYGKGTLPMRSLSRLQREIFRLLVNHEGEVLSNERIVGCYEEFAEELKGVPRRANYFIAEIRKKLGTKSIIRTVTGLGYTIPRL